MLAASSSKTLWYFTRGTGLVSLVLLTASIALGVLELVRFASPRWPRFVVAALHKNLSLLATAFICAHIVTAVADSYAPIRIVDVFVPFIGSYRPVWLGLGAVAFDLLLALIVTSLLRERLGYRLWRAIHWSAYAAWPVALLHGLGTGSDTRVRWAVLVNVVCLAAVVSAVLLRVGWTRTVSVGRRATVALGTAVLTVGVVAWTLIEPMRPGWARKAGTPAALLASTSAALGAGSSSAAQVPVPFSSDLRGRLTQTTSDRTGLTTVIVTGALTTIQPARLRVVIVGRALADGGVDMQRGTVAIGTGDPSARLVGGIVSLSGSHIVASTHSTSGAAVTVTLNLSVDASSNNVTGTVSGRTGGSGSGE